MGDGGISIGHDSTAYTENSIALGARAGTSWFNGNNTAIGADSQTNGIDAVAIGYGARVGDFVDDAWNRSASSAVALGAHSYANRSNTVSVGDVQAGLTRQITSMAAGTEANDAVNVAQLDSVRAVADRLDSTLAIGKTDTDEVAAHVDGLNALALGSASNAIGDGANALGSGSLALGRDAVAVGRNASAADASAVAVGGVASVPVFDAAGSIVGAQEQATLAQARGAAALGSRATATRSFATAVGTGLRPAASNRWRLDSAHVRRMMSPPRWARSRPRAVRRRRPSVLVRGPMRA